MCALTSLLVGLLFLGGLRGVVVVGRVLEPHGRVGAFVGQRLAQTLVLFLCDTDRRRRGGRRVNFIVSLQLPHIHPFTDRRRCQPCKVTTNTSGAGRVRWRLAQGHLDTWLGGGGARGPNQEPSCCQTTDLTS